MTSAGLFRRPAAPAPIAPRCSHPGCSVPASWRPAISFRGPDGALRTIRLPRLVCSEHALPFPRRLLRESELEQLQRAFVRNGIAPPTWWRLEAHFEGRL